MNLEFLGKYILSGEIRCVTGLHIGGMTTGVEIGGMENPVIKDPLTEEPYVPGSSLKGKLRALFEWSHGLIAKHPKHQGYAAYSCEQELAQSREAFSDKKRWDAAYALARLFGPASDDTAVRVEAGPTRLTVRDAFPTGETRDKWLEILGEGLFTEVKTENALDRVTSEANPRPMERVPAGSAFGFTMIFDVYGAEDVALLKELLATMHLLEHSTLGGSGSRGHGQVTFQALRLEWRPVTYYRTGQGQKRVVLPEEGKNLESVIKGLDTIALP
jgi:CRISPR-associated protein Csm3